MAEFTAKDVQALRQATGAGMMDAKKALVEAEGDFDAAAKKLREKGLAKAATRSDRDNVEGVVAVADVQRVLQQVGDECVEGGRVGVGDGDLGGVALAHAGLEHAAEVLGAHAEHGLGHVLEALPARADEEGDGALWQRRVADGLGKVRSQRGGRDH